MTSLDIAAEKLRRGNTALDDAADALTPTNGRTIDFSNVTGSQVTNEFEEPFNDTGIAGASRNLSRFFSEDVNQAIDDYTGVPPSPYDESPDFTEANSKYENFNTFGKLSSEIARSSGRFLSGVAGFLTGIPSWVLDPRGSLENPNTENPFTDLIKQEGGGLIDMIKDMPAQVHFKIMKEVLQVKDPSKHTPDLFGLFDDYKEKVNRYHEAPESPLFAIGIGRGALKLGGKGVAKFESRLSKKSKPVVETPRVVGKAEQSAQVFKDAINLQAKSDKFNKSPVGKEGLKKRLSGKNIALGAGATVAVASQFSDDENVKKAGIAPLAAGLLFVGGTRGKVRNKLAFGKSKKSVLPVKPKAEVPTTTEIKVETGFIAKAKARISKGVALGKEIVSQAKNTVKQPESKKVFSEIGSADEIWHSGTGKILEDFRATEFSEKKGIFNKYKGEELSNMLEAGNAPKLAKVMDGILDALRESGEDVGKLPKYFSRVWKRGIAEAIKDDIQGAIKGIEKTGNVSDRAILNALEKSETKNAIKELMADGKVKTYQQALDVLDRMANDVLVGNLSFLKKRSNLELPSSFYERDARVVLKWYADAASKRIAINKTWGVDATGLSKSLEKIGDVDLREARKVKELHEIWSGEYNRKHNIGGTAQTVVDAVIAAEFATKIAGGTATIPNITQSLISTLVDLGYIRGIRGQLRNLTEKGRSMVRRSGALNNNLLHSILGDSGTGAMGKTSQALGQASGFTGINKFNMSLAASTMEVALKDWHRIANKKGGLAFFKRQAKERLRQHGVDWTKPLTEDILARKMYRFAVDSQLQRNMLNDPVWFNKWWAKPFVLFKRFGYRQMTRRKEMLMNDIKARDPLPTLRLIAGGLAGGEFVIWAKNLIFEGITGQPYYRKEDLLSWERAVNNLIAVGSVGLMTDMMNFSDAEDIPSALKSTVSSIGFAANPVVISDTYQAYKAVTLVLDNWTKYGEFWYAVRLSTKPAARIAGSLTSAVAKRFTPDAQAARKLEFKLGREKRELLRLFSIGEGEKASKLIILWNEAYKGYSKEYHIIQKDITYPKITAYMISRAKKKAEGNR